MTNELLNKAINLQYDLNKAKNALNKSTIVKLQEIQELDENKYEELKIVIDNYVRNIIINLEKEFEDL